MKVAISQSSPHSAIGRSVGLRRARLSSTSQHARASSARSGAFIRLHQMASEGAPLAASVAPNRAGGFLMVDCLIYIVVWSVIVGLAFSSFYRCLSSSRDLSRNANDVVRALQAGERWRDDIRAASGPPRLVAEDGGVAFEIPTPSSLTVYIFEKNSIWRKADLAAPWQKVLAGVKSSRMERSPRKKVVAWSWEVELQTKKQQVRVTPLFNFVAVSSSDQNP